MIPCTTCGSHARPLTSCPSCGSPVRIARTSVAALMLGLAVAGCGGDGDKSTTDTTGDTGETQHTTGVDYGTSPVLEALDPVDEPKLENLHPDRLSE